MIRISAGSAACMGLTANRMDAYPTTAYFLSGDNCRMGCRFCPRGSGNGADLNRLGRVTWPEFNWDQVKEGLIKAEKNGTGRICLQSVRHDHGIKPLLDVVGRFKSLSGLPLSLSAWIKDQKEAAALFKAGADRVSISIDLVNPEIYGKLKGGSMQERVDLLLNCAYEWPGRMITHIICGLGESEREALALIDRLVKAGVKIALFAFVPLKGTPLEDSSSPPVDAYRRVQAGYYLIDEELADYESFAFNDQGRLISFGVKENLLVKYLSPGTAFQTSGCPGCNRPFYNERPGGTIYNYHRPLSEQERKNDLEILLKSLQ